jgi:hypothetical protein
MHFVLDVVSHSLYLNLSFYLVDAAIAIQVVFFFESLWEGRDWVFELVLAVVDGTELVVVFEGLGAVGFGVVEVVPARIGEIITAIDLLVLQFRACIPPASPLLDQLIVVVNFVGVSYGSLIELKVEIFLL